MYTFQITYTECERRIWRTAAVSSNYTLAGLGYLVLATFKTCADHLFDIKYKNTTYFLTEEDFKNLRPWDGERYELLRLHKLGDLGLAVGDVLEMTYDYGCKHVFEIVLREAVDMPKKTGRAYPKILDGAGWGIVDDAFPSEMWEAIQKQDADGHSNLFCPNAGYFGPLEWDYKNYDLESDHILLKGEIDRIRNGYEPPEYEDED